MTAIGGKHRKPHLPTQPQVVIQRAEGLNEYAVFGVDTSGQAIVGWIGDRNAATKFDSKYSAKSRTREISDIPDSRVFRVLETARA